MRRNLLSLGSEAAFVQIASLYNNLKIKIEMKKRLNFQKLDTIVIFIIVINFVTNYLSFCFKKDPEEIT